VQGDGTSHGKATTTQSWVLRDDRTQFDEERIDPKVLEEP
jgi:hypothetical protein